MPRRLPALLLLALVSPAFAQTTQSDPTTQRRAKDIAEIEDYLVKVFSEPLTRKDRLPRLIALCSLAEIDSPKTTAPLLGQLKQKDPLIAYMAWEMLRTRLSSLSPDEREKWLAGGARVAENGAFPKHTVTPLLIAMAERSSDGYEANLGKLVDTVIADNSVEEPRSKAALIALGRLLKTWQDRKLIQRVINTAKPDFAPRVKLVLEQIAPLPAGDKLNRGQLGSWLGELKFDAAASYVPYVASDLHFAPPVKIIDPYDKKWSSKLELSALTVDRLELAWVIDSTGSMQPANDAVVSQTRHVMAVLSIVAQETRVASVYFRHEIEPAFMKKCCVEVVNLKNADAYRTTAHDFTKDASAMASIMSNQPYQKGPDAKTGNAHADGQCAVLGGLQGASQLKWSTAGRKAIVIVGDSSFTDNTVPSIIELGKKLDDSGAVVIALTMDGAIEGWVGTLKLAKITQIPFDPKTPLIVPKTKLPLPAAATLGPFDLVIMEILRSVVPEQYRERIDPLLPLLIDYTRALGV